MSSGGVNIESLNAQDLNNFIISMCTIYDSHPQLLLVERMSHKH